MTSEATLTLTTALVSGLVIGWVCWPYLLLALGWIVYQNGTTGGPGDLDPDGMDEDYQRKYFQLVDLGFLPRGIHWSQVGRQPSTETYVFGSRDLPCMVEVFARSWNVYLLTAFADGTAVETGDAAANEVQTDGLWIGGVPDHPLHEVLSIHRQRVDPLIAEGRQPLPSETLDDFARVAQAVNSHPLQRRMLRAKARRYVALLLAGMVCMGLMAGCLSGFETAAPWVAVMLAGLLLKWDWYAASLQVPRKRESDA